MWNVREYDNNKLICSCWTTPHIYLVDRNDTESRKKPKIIEERDSNNNHATDLWLIAGYSFHKCPFVVKRAAMKVSLIDVRNLKEYVMFKDENTEWGYNKLSVVDRGNDRFELVFATNGPDDKNSVMFVKRYSFPAYYLQGLRKVANLTQHKQPQIY